MSGISKTSKLAMLRAKTDRELLTLIRMELDRGLALASAGVKGSRSHAQAEEAFERAKALLPTIPNLNRWDRAKLEAALSGLRVKLDALPESRALQYRAGSGGCA